ncbi:MAG: hypothetical protein AAFP70_22200, partial [Calditrichota bacterium]
RQFITANIGGSTTGKNSLMLLKTLLQLEFPVRPTAESASVPTSVMSVMFSLILRILKRPLIEAIPDRLIHISYSMLLPVIVFCVSGEFL